MTCTPGAVVGPWLLSVPEDLQSRVTADAIFAARVAVGRAVDLREEKMIDFPCRVQVKEGGWAVLCNTLARATVPFRRVAAASYSGASRLQWPHLRDKGCGSVRETTSSCGQVSSWKRSFQRSNWRESDSSESKIRELKLWLKKLDPPDSKVFT